MVRKDEFKSQRILQKLGKNLGETREESRRNQGGISKEPGKNLRGHFVV